MALYYITSSNWLHFIQQLSRVHAVYGLTSVDDHLRWTRVRAESMPELTVTCYRALHPVKQFFFPLSEEVTREPADVKTVLIGVKACDLNHLKTSDAIFMGGVGEDPYYARKRKNTIIIAADCDAARTSCFCTRMGEHPWPDNGFDLSLSPTRAGFLVETGSPVGEALIIGKKHLFQTPQNVLQHEREQLRQKMTETVNKINAGLSWENPRRIIEQEYEARLWKDDISSTCVECDACRFTCGSCYCFLLSETKILWEKKRSWDSCQSAGYGRVAGGANPRKTRDKRLRNFYSCKLMYRPDNFGFYACTGCGRCIDVCQGKIDIRQSLQKLSQLHPSKKTGEEKSNA